MKILKKIWQNNFSFAVLMATVFLLFHFFILPRIPKIPNEYIIGLIFIFSAILLSPFLFFILLIALVSKKGSPLSGISLFGEKGIIRNVSSNKVWIIRNGRSSNPGGIDQEGKEISSPSGYTALSEGWRFYIPILFIDMGTVDLAPLPRDHQSVTVNASDGQTAIIDWRMETFVSDPVRYIIRTQNEEKRFEFERQRANVVLSQISSKFSQEGLTSFRDNQLKKLGKDALQSFNEGISVLGIQACAFDIQNILPPQTVMDAAMYKTVSQKRLEAAETKGEEIGTLIQKTGANPTLVMFAEMLRGALENLFKGGKKNV